MMHSPPAPAACPDARPAPAAGHLGAHWACAGPCSHAPPGGGLGADAAGTRACEGSRHAFGFPAARGMRDAPPPCRTAPAGVACGTGPAVRRGPRSRPRPRSVQGWLSGGCRAAPHPGRPRPLFALRPGGPVLARGMPGSAAYAAASPAAAPSGGGCRCPDKASPALCAAACAGAALGQGAAPRSFPAMPCPEPGPPPRREGAAGIGDARPGDGAAIPRGAKPGDRPRAPTRPERAPGRTCRPPILPCRAA